MKEINFSNKYLNLNFVIDENKHIRLSFFGDNKNYIRNPSTFVELELTEENHANKNPGKKCSTYFGVNSTYVSHKIKDNELVIVTTDEHVKVETHFILHKNIKGLSTYNVVKNISKSNLHLEFISSFYIHGLGQDINPCFKGLSVVYARNGWNSECQWKKEAFKDLALFNTNNKVNMNRFALVNTGSWSTKEFLPILGIENTRKEQFILSQIEHNGSWVMEVGDILNKYYLCASGPCLHDNSFVKVLKPNDSFESVHASTAIGKDFEEANQEMTKLRRAITNPSIDHKEMPVIFNDFMHGTWDLSKEELIKPMVDTAKEVGVDTFVLDAGWFAPKTGWPDYIGEWKACDENYPSGGLKGMFDYIRNKGMKCGLWFEIENMGIKCPIAKKFKDSSFFIVNNKKSVHANRYCLNFDNKEVFDWAMSIVSGAVRKYGLDYIKLDYNLDAGVGNEYSSDSLGDGLLQHNRAVIRWIETLQKKFPNLTIENCASGGQRMDYQMLKVLPIQSSSDLEDYTKYPFIAANILAACPPEVGAIWAYPVCNDTVKFDIDDEVVAFNMVNSMLGRLHLASKIQKLTPTQLQLVKEGVQVHKKLASFKKRALPIFPNGTAKFFDKSVVAGLTDDKSIILNVWNTSDEANIVKVNLLKYGVLDAKVLYPVKLTTKFSFEPKTGLLTVKFPKGHMARTFKLIIKE